MANNKKLGSVSRRGFLATTGSMITVGPALARSAAPAAGETPLPRPAFAPTPTPARKIPIGVFDSAYNGIMNEPVVPTDEMIDKLAAIGMEAIEIGAGGQNRTHHCPMEELLADPAKAKAWQKKFSDRNITIGALAMHGNPVHPDPAIAAKHDKSMRDCVLLAERLEIPVLVAFSGCPGAGPGDQNPNFITIGYKPQLEWQWNEKVIPYWREFVKFSRQHGNPKLAMETHDLTVTYTAGKVLKLRQAVGEEIGANVNFSHLFMQGVDPVEVIRYLGKEGVIYHAHIKDQGFFKDYIAKNGIWNSPTNLRAAAQGGADCAYFYCTIGYGHPEQMWRDIVKAYMDVGFQGIFSIEAEDPYLSCHECVTRSVALLKRIRESLLAQSA